jgi:hypothetical protein
MIIGSPTEVLIAGRGTGKTEGVVAEGTSNRFFKTMPRGAGVIVGATFSQLMTRTLPGLIAGWELLGYKMGQHYLIGQKPDAAFKKRWKWEGPYRPPLDYKYFVSWFNGAGAHLVSQERPGSSNGITIDWIAGDEAKLLNEERLKTELFPANRGILPAFKNNPYHHGLLFVSDMPVGTSGRWLLDWADKMNVSAVTDIWKYQTAIFKLKQAYFKANSKQKKEIEKQINIVKDEINTLRKGLLYYHEASTLDNIAALGADYIKQQLRDTTLFQFDTQILNIRPKKVENGFYPDLNEDKHGYFSENDEYFDRQTYEPGLSFNCLKDGDINNELPLHISIDYNKRIHCIVIAQDDGKVIRIVNNIHALYPGKLKEALVLFCDYYKPFKRRMIYFWYDHTAVGGENDTAKCDDVVNILSNNGWVVEQMYTGKAPDHESKYRMYGNLLQENGWYARVLRFNRENARYLLTSMGLAGTEARKDGFGKDKKSEHDDKFPAEESTHYSDALDMMTYGMFEKQLMYRI